MTGHFAIRKAGFTQTWNFDHKVASYFSKSLKNWSLLDKSETELLQSTIPHQQKEYNQIL